ncbi:MAG: LamG domain-containing protein [Thermoanaerobaculia bacterium]
MNRTSSLLVGAVAIASLLAVARAEAQPFDGYLRLEGITTPGYLETPNASALDVNAAGKLTIEGWVYRFANDGSQSCRSLVGKDWQTSYWVGVCNDTLRSYVHGNSSVKDSGTIPVGSWTHFAVVSDGLVRKHYINGRLTDTFTNTSLAVGRNFPLRIGSDVSWNFPPNAFLDEVRIWNVARSAEQILGWQNHPILASQFGLTALYRFDGNGTSAFNASLSGTSSGNVIWASTAAATRTLFVPVVLKSSYSSELTLTNRGTTAALVSLTYKAASGGGDGSRNITIPPGRQVVQPDAIEYLRSLGLAISDSGTRLGTLLVRFSNLSDANAAAVTVRTGTDVASPAGRAGLAYSGIPIERALTGRSTIGGLRLNGADRSNLAVQNVGGPGDPDVTLRITAYSGNPAQSFNNPLADLTLPPGGFRQFSPADLALPDGFQGYATIDRVSASGKYYAYGVVNDQVNSDGSFVPPFQSTPGVKAITVPVVVESGDFRTETVVANLSAVTRTVALYFFSPSATDGVAFMGLELAPRQQFIYSDTIASLRAFGQVIASPAGAGALVVADTVNDASDLFVGARTLNAAPGGGRFGLFYVGVANGASAPGIAWLNGLQQNSVNRTNTAFVNPINLTNDSLALRLEIFDGDTGAKVATIDDAPGLTALGALQFLQINRLLSTYAPAVTNGYARISRLSGTNFPITYAVVNDGAAPGERTGDGAFVPMDLPLRPGE